MHLLGLEEGHMVLVLYIAGGWLDFCAEKFANGWIGDWMEDP